MLSTEFLLLFQYRNMQELILLLSDLTPITVYLLDMSEWIQRVLSLYSLIHCVFFVDSNNH